MNGTNNHPRKITFTHIIYFAKQMNFHKFSKHNLRLIRSYILFTESALCQATVEESQEVGSVSCELRIFQSQLFCDREEET